MSTHSFDQLPDSALIRQKQLLAPAGPLPFSGPTLWRRVKAKTFPEPIRITDGRMTAWRVSDVRAWLAEQGVQPRAAA